MGKALTITIYPAAEDAEYLSASDAMRQVLDLIETLERTESSESGERRIVWRLTEAHTNSPPFTVTLEAFPVNPVMSVDFEAMRLTTGLDDALTSLLDRRDASKIDRAISQPLQRLLRRNMNGIGRTRIAFDEFAVVDIVPQNAQLASTALSEAEAPVENQARTEVGSSEVIVNGVTRWNGKHALNVTDRFSQSETTCVLTEDLAEKLGGSHTWSQAWQGRRLMVMGFFHYAKEGSLRRIDAEDAEDMPWTDVDIADLSGIDLLSGISVSDHLNKLRGEWDA
jgi:hypothetical protein